jgi:hypothetical protein
MSLELRGYEIDFQENTIYMNIELIFKNKLKLFNK